MVFTPSLTTIMQQGILHDFVEQIETVEPEGWTLADWSVTHNAYHTAVAYPAFRRRA